MISLSAEMTDAKGRRASRGWIFFDRDCSFCMSLAQRFHSTFEKRGFGLAALQDPRVATLLGLPPDQLLGEMRVVTANNELYGGSDDIWFLARANWWGRAIYSGASLSGIHHIFPARYCWLADDT